MKATRLFVAAALGASTLTGAFGAIDRAGAQNATTGAVQGVVKDDSTGEALAGVTVVVTGPTSQPQTTFTDDNGFYKVTGLPPNSGYTVTFYYADLTLERQGITVGVGKTAPVYVKLKTDTAGGETIVVVDSVPTIDPTSTSQGITLDSEYLDKIPVPGRSFEDALGAAAGSQGDDLGVAFSGSSSIENQYYVDGVNTTNLQFGNVGTSVVNNFIEEIEVITGGYNAEYGRATGGVINVVTKSGSNDIKGSAWVFAQPGFLVGQLDRIPVQYGSVDAQTDSDYVMDFGVEIGGPIIKDKAWWWIGVVPQLSSATTTRITKRRTDCRQVDPVTGELTTPLGESRVTGNATDGSGCSESDLEMYRDDEFDVDPETGYYIYEDLDVSELSHTGRGGQFHGKVNYAATPEHQGQVSTSFSPGRTKTMRPYGFIEQQQVEISGYTLDTAAKWTSKFNDNKTEVELLGGFHRDFIKQGSAGGDRDHIPLQYLLYGTLGDWSRLGGESDATTNGCSDDPGSGDPFPGIINCPDEGIGYAVGGPGALRDDTQERFQIKLSAVQRVKAVGTHEIKGGVDMEDNRLSSSRMLSGDAYLENDLGGGAQPPNILVQRYAKLADPDSAFDEDFYDQICRGENSEEEEIPYPCHYIGVDDAESRIPGRTINWSAYLRDSWQVRPNITINAGLRYEEQRLRYVEYLQGTVDQLTGRDLGTNAMVMRNMWAPRLGVLYDWTKEGRSKIYGHWGRFYESIPLRINERSFGGEVTLFQFYEPESQCATPDMDEHDAYGGSNGEHCLEAEAGSVPAYGEQLLGSGTLVAPGIKPQYMDEIIFGLEYELMDDLKLGIAFQNRRLGRVIEDVSTDGASTYVIANPGEWSSEEEQALMDQIDNAEPGSATEARLQRELAMFQGIRLFDKPRRDYNALQFTATRRFSKALYMQASYTYSRTEGNFPGLYSPDNGQLDPNISSQYDLIELLANRNGPLPQDRPHYVKLDGYYTFDFKKAGQATAGVRFRALSGTPVDVLGRHYKYGPGESFLLPRGSIRRTDFDSNIDLHVDYGRELRKGLTVELFADIFNVINDQGTYAVDEQYTRSPSNPIVGGTYEDLIFAKQNALDSGAESTTPVARNPNFGNVAVRYAPISARFGLQITF